MFENAKSDNDLTMLHKIEAGQLSFKHSLNQEYKMTEFLPDEGVDMRSNTTAQSVTELKVASSYQTVKKVTRLLRRVADQPVA